jgi:hypothetical protein
MHVIAEKELLTLTYSFDIADTWNRLTDAQFVAI